MLLKQPTEEQQAQEKAAKLAKSKKNEDQTFDYIGLDDKKERISFLLLLYYYILIIIVIDYV